MRLFPPPEEGLHEAFLPQAHPRTTPTPIAFFPTAAGLVGLAALPVALFFGKTRTVSSALASSTKVTAYSCLALGGLATFGEAVQSRSKRIFLAEHGISVPSCQWYQRTGTFDSDDAAIWGALGAVAIAASLPRPWIVNGWRRWVGAAAMSTTLSRTAHAVWYSGGSLEMVEANNAQNEAVAARRLKGLAELTRAHQARMQQQTTAATPPSWNDTRPPVSSPSTVTEMEPGPHVRPGAEEEQSGLPSFTNYLWSGTVAPERVVPELEGHLETLTEQRRSVAKEAELLWHWLAEREGEYYELRERAIGLEDEQKKEQILNSLRILGAQHLNLWLDVSKTDWAIADARKRIAQHRSRLEKDDQGQRQIWMPRAPAVDGAQPLVGTLRMLRKHLKDIENEIAQAQEKHPVLMKAFERDSPFVPKDVAANVKTDPHWREQLEHSFLQQQRKRAAQKELFESVIRDVEKKAQELCKNADEP